MEATGTGLVSEPALIGHCAPYGPITGDSRFCKGPEIVPCISQASAIVPTRHGRGTYSTLGVGPLLTDLPTYLGTD